MGLELGQLGLVSGDFRLHGLNAPLQLVGLRVSFGLGLGLAVEGVLFGVLSLEEVPLAGVTGQAEGLGGFEDALRDPGALPDCKLGSF